MNERVSIIKSKEKEIIYIDFSNLENQDKIRETINVAKQMIRQKGEKKALVITNLTNGAINIFTSKAIKDFTKHNTPYVDKSAIFGINSAGRVILIAVKLLTKRDFYVASNLEDAIEYITK